MTKLLFLAASQAAPVNSQQPGGAPHPAPVQQGAPGPVHPQQQQDPSRSAAAAQQDTSMPATQTMSGSFEAQKDYSQSLDKLNSSLTELQGEIMKLSLSHSTKTTNSHMTTAPGQHVPPHTHAPSTRPPEPSAGEPDVVSARSSAPNTTVIPSHVTHPQPVIPAMPHPGYPPQPGYPSFIPGQYPVGYVPYPTIPPTQPYVPPPIGYAAFPPHHPQPGGYYPGLGYQQQPPMSQPSSQPQQQQQQPSSGQSRRMPITQKQTQDTRRAWRPHSASGVKDQVLHGIDA